MKREIELSFDLFALSEAYVIYCNVCETIFSILEEDSCIGMWDQYGYSRKCPLCKEGIICHFLPEWYEIV